MWILSLEAMSINLSRVYSKREYYFPAGVLHQMIIWVGHADKEEGG